MSRRSLFCASERPEEVGSVQVRQQREPLESSIVAPRGFSIVREARRLWLWDGMRMGESCTLTAWYVRVSELGLGTGRATLCRIYRA